MSEAELHLIRSRLTAGLRHKAARGELRQFLPVGFDYDETGAVVITPDEAVVEAIATVLRRFAELGTGRQVLLSLRGDGLLLPRRPTRTGRVHRRPGTIASRGGHRGPPPSSESGGSGRGSGAPKGRFAGSPLTRFGQQTSPTASPAAPRLGVIGAIDVSGHTGSGSPASPSWFLES